VLLLKVTMSSLSSSSAWTPYGLFYLLINFVFHSTNYGFVVVGLSSPVDRSTNGCRRAFLQTAVIGGGISTAAMILSSKPAMADQPTIDHSGIKVDPFNGLAFNYRGGEFAGLDASLLEEPSISYAQFNEKLKANEVELVEFYAPDGDVAYATLKLSSSSSSSSADDSSPNSSEIQQQQRIRIGEGYPIEQHDGYSSPMFCVRVVKDAGVPYKFVVKGLGKSL